MSRKPYICVNTNIISVCQGSDYEDIVEVDTSLLLAGCSATSQLRDLDGTLIGSFTCQIEGQSIKRKLDKSLTSTLKAPQIPPFFNPTYVWGLQITDGNGFVYPEIQGGVRVTQGIVEVIP